MFSILLSGRELNMNSVIEAINKRCSTRAYEQKPVPKKIIEAIIDAGNKAPFTSVTRSQPWRFVVVQDQDFKQKLFQTAFPFWKNATDGMKEQYPELYEMATCLYNAMDHPKDVIYYNAPVIVFVVGPATGGAISCALACENMMIAASSFGLGSCYTGFGAMVKGNPEVVEILELSENEQIYGPILIGYSKNEPDAAVSNALERICAIKKEPVTKWI
ncbi:nitroreductase family protein [Candidatus Bathyarchaeota archaeon]|nr:nitroreductase family protein [Candidatus Bathyarchaeota archaeon]